MTGTPGRDQRRQRVLVDRRHRPGAHVRGRADLQRDPLLGQVAPAAAGPARRRCRARSARRPARAARPRSSPAPVVSPACGTLCSPAARALSKYGLNCGRGTPISGPPSPKLTSPSGRSLERDPQRLLGGRQARPRPGCRSTSAARCRARRSAALPGVLDRLAERRRRDAPRDVRVRRDGQLGVPDLLAGQLAGHLVGQDPDVLGVADQVDDAQVDLDEVREVAEREVVGERRRVGRHRRAALVPGGQLGDDPRRGRADVVHVQLGLGQSGDECGQIGQRGSTAGSSALAPPRRPGGTGRTPRPWRTG